MSETPATTPTTEPAKNPPPGPKVPLLATADLQQVARGFLMGGADIIPGVSGGTVALIVGIYERLVTAISHFDVTLIKLLKQRQWTSAVQRIDLRFLVFLGLGIGLGIVGLASLMHTLLADYTQYTLAAFTGLIVASSFLVARMVDRWTPGLMLCLLAGVGVAYWICGLPLLNQPPEGNLYVFFCGMVAICAMILPGISGAFILLILGKYSDITGLLKDVLHGQITVEAVTTIAVFVTGCALGLIGFSKFLRWLLARHERQTMALLCGFMAGSLRKIWPFRVDLTPEIEKFKLKQFENVWPDLSQGSVWLSLVIAGLAVAFVLALDRITAGHSHVPPLEDHDHPAGQE